MKLLEHSHLEFSSDDRVEPVGPFRDCMSYLKQDLWRTVVKSWGGAGGRVNTQLSKSCPKTKKEFMQKAGRILTQPPRLSAHG